MEQSAPRVRVAVLSAATPLAGDTLGALRRLGGEVEIDVVRDVDAYGRLASEAALDLVVLDGARAADAHSLLAMLRDSGPPTVVVARQAGEEVALDAFRNGASDCVRVGEDYAEVLPLVALEQIRRWRPRRERDRLSRRIGELQRYNENIIQHMNSALVVVDRAGRINYANPTAEGVLRTLPGELEGRSIWDWFADRPRGELLIAKTLDTGARFKGAETVICFADHSAVPIGISCAPLIDDDGKQQGAVAIFQDLSEIKQLQRQLLQSEKMASIGQLAAGVAHEINNPMGFIHANLYQLSEYVADLQRVWTEVESLRQAVASGSADSAREAAQALSRVSEELDVEFVLSDLEKAIRESQEGSERIRHIVQDLRDFSHQDTAERVLADVNQCVDSTASIVWTMMKHSVVLDKEYADLPRVPGFPMQLKQVFMNLLVNAYQAIEEKIDGKGDTGRITVRTAVRDEGVVVSIEDTGTGITAEHLGRIFDPFFTTKQVGAGTGLGLSTSYNIVQRHGGRIDVESEPGAGTRFEVWLPLDGPVVESEGQDG